MTAAFPDALVTGREPPVDGITLPDLDHRHVVAAAIRGRADVIVTANGKDFPAEVLNALGIAVQTPSLFLLDQLDLAPTATIRALDEQARATRRPPLTLEVLLARLAACGAPRFSAAARQQVWRYDTSSITG